MSHQPQFDRHAFYGSGRFLKNSGLSYSDMEHLHVERVGDVQPERRLPTPSWAMRDEMVREVLVAYLEERFYTTRHRQGTLQERLAQCRAAAESYLPSKREILDGWIKDFRTVSTGGFAELSDEDAQLKCAGLSEYGGQGVLTPEIARDALTAKKLKDLELQIMNIDTDIFLTERGHAEMVAAIVYLYYRLSWNSVSIAEELGLKPPHIRQVLYRLNQTAQSLSQKLNGIGTAAVNIQAEAELNINAGENSDVPDTDSPMNFTEPLFQCASGLHTNS